MRLLVAIPALVFLALAGCSLNPGQTDPYVDANVALVQTDPDARAEAPAPDVGADAARHALEMIGAPYRYGGKTPEGFDCSGLVLYSYALAGRQLPANLAGQRAASRPVPRRQARPGDLLFFHLTDEGRSHVGLYIGGGLFVHAPSRGKLVSTASLSHPYWRRQFAGARRPAHDPRTQLATNSRSGGQ